MRLSPECHAATEERTTFPFLRELSVGSIGVISILHEDMDLSARLKADAARSEEEERRGKFQGTFPHEGDRSTSDSGGVPASMTIELAPPGLAATSRAFLHTLMPSPITDLPVTFPVLRSDEPASVTLDFATHANVMAAARWRIPAGLKGSLHSRAADAREFAILAAKRWRHYRDTSTAASSLSAMQRMIAADPHGEFCFHLTVTAPWFAGSLGGAMIRRTWCHHLIVDFLFVHPRLSGQQEPVRGVGLGILQGICCVAAILGCRRVWGETTRDSAPFYQRRLRTAVTDSFFLTPGEITYFAAQLATSVANIA